MPKKATTKAEPIRRSLTETYDPDGAAVFEYVSEAHSIRVTAVAHTPRAETGYVLRRMAAWLLRGAPPSNDPWVGEGDPWVEEPPF